MSPTAPAPHSPRLLALLEGMHEECDLTTPEQPPPWMDQQRFAAGQAVFRAHSLGILISNMRNLVFGFSVPTLCYPLVLTDKGNTPEDAYRRYNLTMLYVWRWYHSNPRESMEAWGNVNHHHQEAVKIVRAKMGTEPVRQMRRCVERVMQEDPHKFRHKVSPAVQVMLQELARLKADQQSENPQAEEIYQNYIASDVLFSQFDMALVLSAFFGVFVGWPAEFGSRFICEKDLMDFTHFWRVVGYCMGIKDEFNIAAVESSAEVRRLQQELTSAIALPAMCDLDEAPLHLGQVTCKAFGMSYPLVVYGQLSLLGYEAPNILRALPWTTFLMYFIRRVLITAMNFCPPLRLFFCHIMNRQLEKRLGNVAKARK